MGTTTYLKKVPGAQCQPRKETVQFILNYSKALDVKTLNSGEQIVFIKN